MLKRKKVAKLQLYGVIIATILITVVLSLFMSFRQYLVNLERASRNWEAEFTDIRYSDALEIEKDNNIKEISIFYNYGEANIISDYLNGKLVFKAYDDNALKNSNLTLVEGKYPENNNEIIISKYLNETFEVGINDEINYNLNNFSKNLKIVGIVESLEEDSRIYGNIKYGAVTYLDKKDLDLDETVNVSILTNNVKKIKETCDNLVNKLHLSELKSKGEMENEKQEYDSLGLLQSITELLKEEEINTEDINKTEENEILIYNTTLLNYELVTDIDKSFATLLVISASIIILIIGLASISVIYTSFKMNFNGRIKDLSTLLSIRYE